MPFDMDTYLRQIASSSEKLNLLDLKAFELELKAIWHCAFPDGLQYREWSQLIYLMYVIDGKQYPMSFRAVARNIGILLNVQYIVLLNEVYGAFQIEPNSTILAWLKQRMVECGYYQWLSEQP